MAYWYDSTSFLAWAIILIYLCIAHRTRLRPIGVVVVPAAFIATLVAYTLQAQENTAIPAYLQNYWLIAHSAVIFLSYAAFIAAFGFGLMYLIEEKKIRKKQHPLIYNLLPALGRSDETGSQVYPRWCDLDDDGHPHWGTLDAVCPRSQMDVDRFKGYLYNRHMAYLCVTTQHPSSSRLARTQNRLFRNHRFCRCVVYLCRR